MSPGYFETTGQKLVAGRLFEERDRNLHSVVVTEGLAKKVWPDRTPLGAEVQIEGRKFNVIGVVADSRATSLKSAPLIWLICITGTSHRLRPSSWPGADRAEKRWW